MRDPMTFERRLAEAYDRWASEMPTDVDALAVVRATRGHRVPARQHWSWRTLRTVVVLAALIGLAIAAALWLAARVRDDTRTGTAYRAIVSRISDESRQLVAVRADGQERVVIALSPVLDARGEVREETWELSSTGWLAIDTGQGWQFIDLDEASPAPTTAPAFPAESRGHSWTPDGRFAEWDESGSMRLFDPRTGTATMLSLTPPLYDIEGWTADGAGFVQGVDEPVDRQIGPERQAWRAVYLDGRTDERHIPALDPWLSAGKGAAGMRLQVCDPQLDGPCPDLPNGAVAGESADGVPTTWYRDELAPDDVIDARFTGDGTAMWLLLDRRAGGRQFVLARADAPGVAREVIAGGLASADGSMTSIVGVAPDDSLVVLGYPVALIEPQTGRISMTQGGQLLGIVPAAEVDSWAGGTYVQVSPGPSLAPVLPAWPTLRPISEAVAEQVPPGTVLWQHEQVASEGATASPSWVVSEPIVLKGDLGVVFGCSGPSDVTVTMDPPLPSDVVGDGLMPLVSRCRLGDGGSLGGSSDGWALDQTVRFSVESAPDTSWQLVVFDPKPR